MRVQRCALWTLLALSFVASSHDAPSEMTCWASSGDSRGYAFLQSQFQKGSFPGTSMSSAKPPGPHTRDNVSDPGTEARGKALVLALLDVSNLVVGSLRQSQSNASDPGIEDVVNQEKKRAEEIDRHLTDFRKKLDQAITADDDADMDAQSLLALVESLAEHLDVGHQPPLIKAAVATFRDLIEWSLFPNLKSTHADGAKEMDGLLKHIVTLNKDISAQLAAIKSTDESNVDTSRSSHTNCRVAESHSEAAFACNDLKVFVQGIRPPEDKPSSDSATEWLHYIKTEGEYWPKRQEQFDRKAAACDDARARNAKQTQECNRLQAQFEIAFCDWRTMLVDACNTFATKYSNQSKLYNERKAFIEELIPEWHAEYIAIKKINCYLDSWLHPSDKLNVGRCKSLQVDASPMDLNISLVPAPEACNTSRVQEYPGTEGFLTKEYAVFKNVSVAPVTQCPL
eukprot:gnl/TRDRNA2_/TRDRNA2_181528_c0_seq1.p1 gnl/TRDRNA2_/TRDRNA2_181528_c0~~gnl/TRDRNA2_/TRDRNA2_181528_c0_seq1.p1  ORF type:complete len:455 (-),score=76.30 gnl/TRDRNA2_/TRDRNA2_181528_c0_seq1:254-1618(-)